MCNHEMSIPPAILMYGGHIHLNQIAEKVQSDFLFPKSLPLIHECQFINNKPKSHKCPLYNPSPFPFHVQIYHKIDIHPEYSAPQII